MKHLINYDILATTSQPVNAVEDGVVSVEMTKWNSVQNIFMSHLNIIEKMIPIILWVYTSSNSRFASFELGILYVFLLYFQLLQLLYNIKDPFTFLFL